MASKIKYRLPIYLRNKLGRGCERTFDKIRDKYDEFVADKYKVCRDFFYTYTYDAKSVGIDAYKVFKQFIKWQPYVDKNHPILSQNDYKSEYDTFMSNAYIIENHLILRKYDDYKEVYFFETRVKNVALFNTSVVFSEDVSVVLYNKLKQILKDNKCAYWVFYPEDTQSDISQYEFVLDLSNLTITEDNVMCPILLQFDEDYLKSICKKIEDAGGDVQDYKDIAYPEVYKIKRRLFTYLRACRKVIKPICKKFEKSYAKAWNVEQPNWNGVNAKKSFKDLV